MKQLDELIAAFTEAFTDAPLYGGYSRTLKRKILSKGDLQRAFIENLQLMKKLSVDDTVTNKINSILSNFE